MENAFAIYGFAGQEMSPWILFDGLSGLDETEFGPSLAKSIGCDALQPEEFNDLEHGYLNRLLTCYRLVHLTPEEFNAQGWGELEGTEEEVE